jgi:uncharacterized repeat protein (TIGR01451 family)
LVSITGAGWSCAGTTCSRSDALAGGNSYPPIAVTVNVGATFGGGSNQVTLSGGGSATLADYDYTNYIANPPVLTISIGDSGNFTQAQTNATYTLSVSNQAGADPTSGPVNVSESLPSGLTLVSIAGTGWTCSPNSYFYSSGCSRSDVLNGGSSYPPITVTVSVGLTATSPQVNTVSVSGVGSASASATDSTVIAAHGPAVTIQANVAGAPFSLEDGSVYQTPATIYWTIGTQHSVTWLTSVPSQPGASYSFESWSDGGSNPRTFTSTGPATYTANIAAFYLLTINIPFAAGGTVTASPAFSNGYYAAGTTVTLTAIPAPGVAAEFNGDFYGSSPLAITMNAPHTETASFVQWRLRHTLGRDRTRTAKRLYLLAGKRSMRCNGLYQLRFLAYTGRPYGIRWIRCNSLLGFREYRLRKSNGLPHGIPWKSILGHAVPRVLLLDVF